MATAAPLDDAGCAHWPMAASTALVEGLVASLPSEIDAGLRLSVAAKGVARAIEIMAPIADAYRPGARPVRAVLFDKSPRRNWAVPWHQDRTIAVKQRVDVDGFGPWSTKDEVIHVEPPFDLLADMLTLRLHLDDCDSMNAPLRVALGSHRSRVPAAAAAAHAQALESFDCLAERGDIWVYATPLLHCSDRAAVPSRRRVFQIDFSAASLPGGLEWAA